MNAVNLLGKNVFVDSNVLLYALDARSPEKAALASNWLDYLWRSQSGRCSWQVLDEFYANAVRKLGSPPQVVRKVLLSYLQWHPLVPSVALVERAWFWSDSTQVTYWDGKILAAAERLGCPYLLSEDFTHQRSFGSVEIINPFQTLPPIVSPHPFLEPPSKKQ